MLIASINEASKLQSKLAVSIVTREFPFPNGAAFLTEQRVSVMLQGQGMDLCSTYLGECPTFEEYSKMIDYSIWPIPYDKTKYPLLTVSRDRRAVLHCPCVDCC